MAPNSRVQIGEDYKKPNLKDDIGNFALLTFLYILEGSIMGIGIALSTILQKRNVTYEDQGEFSFIWCPFAFKIFYAPIVDSVYFKKLGRRKSWLIITQYLTGVFLLLLAMNIHDWLGTEDGLRKPNVRILAVTFFLCHLLTSIQDIALDGWSITIFQEKNIAYSAVSQSIGVVGGMSVISAAFIMLESKDFGNKFRSVPQNYGLVSFSEFLFFWSLLIIISTTLLLLFKKENKNGRLDVPKEDDDEHKLSIKKTYVLLGKILKIRPVLIFTVFLLTRNIGSAPVSVVASLKLLDNGITRDTLATLSLLQLPIQLCVPLVMRRFITGRRPLRIFLLFYVLSQINTFVFAVYVFLISYWKNHYNVLPTWYFWALICISCFQSVVGCIMSTTLAATFSRISDPKFGGVYMTFLNSINNVGFFCSTSLSLWLVNPLTLTSCSVDKAKEEKCYTMIDGFYVEVVAFALVGVLWIFWGKKTINCLEKYDASAFRVKCSPIEERSLPLMNKNENLKTDAIDL